MIKSAEIQRPYPLGHGGRLGPFLYTRWLIRQTNQNILYLYEVDIDNMHACFSRAHAIQTRGFIDAFDVVTEKRRYPPAFTRGIWKVRSMIDFLSNR